MDGDVVRGRRLDTEPVRPFELKPVNADRRLTSSGRSGSRLITTPLSMKQPPSFRFSRKTGKSSNRLMS
jgi:hypothetical protein